ncbi:MAG: peptidase asparaginase 2 [Verrucomicrobia bacterium]|nr:peptidase asparaginase 2 [Verrucomicrobiota bacterium]
MASAASDTPSRPFGLVIHGGAGNYAPPKVTPEKERAYRTKLQEALDAGYAVLDRGGPALDAVVATIRILEDSPLFNAGHGAVLNADGICELDSSIMDGSNLRAGAVAGLQHIRNPIALARAVMEKSPHVMLIGAGAERFAQENGFALVPNDYFQTEERREDLRELQEKLKNPAKAPRVSAEPANAFGSEHQYGTVGCVALDRQGNLAAGTSTGGLANKRFGRVGDAPIIGAGTYADNATCGVSCTGTGEYFIRAVAAHDVSARIAYQGKSLGEAAAATLAKIGQLGGDGGLIALDREGHVAMPFNTAGMSRGFRLSTGESRVAVFPDPK